MTLLVMKVSPYEMAWKAVFESQKMTCPFACPEGERALYMSRACTIAWSSQVKLDAVFPAPNFIGEWYYLE